MLDEPLHLKEGQGITFTCEFINDSDNPIDFGFGVDSEMCASMNNYSYPAGQPCLTPPGLSTIIMDNDVPAVLLDTTLIPTPF